MYGQEGIETEIRRYSGEQTAKERTADELLAILESLHEPGRLLDVGSHLGFFLERARSRGWEVEGVEPFRAEAEWCRTHLEIPVRTATLREAGFEPGSFDCVTMINVLEHLPDPAADLSEVARILRPGGVLAVEVPNFGSRVARVMGRRWRHIFRGHYHQFKPATLERLMRHTGLDTARRTSATKHASLGFILRRALDYGYLPAGIFGALEGLLEKTGMAGRIVRMRFPDVMRLFARKPG
jgi:2-polyprenyl-3-methyl-5-hydroxy-6-metoxy-1,4-benzoquinol methylase